MTSVKVSPLSSKRVRDQLIDGLVARGLIRSAAIESAWRNTRRDVFLPASLRIRRCLMQRRGTGLMRRCIDSASRDPTSSQAAPIKKSIISEAQRDSMSWNARC